MSPRLQSKTAKGLAVAALHVAIVSSLGVKLLIDRATRPRVWARAAPADPTEPIHGRYVTLHLEAAIDPALVFVPGGELDIPYTPPANPSFRMLPRGSTAVSFAARNQQLVAMPAPSWDYPRAHPEQRGTERVAVIDIPVAYFIPDPAQDPSLRPAGEELWVEVTIPRRGAPRPIRLGVKKNGVLTPLDLR